MSIDFTTLQGLTIPEGVVTQITDAAGNVLWSAGGNIVEGTLYLRPSSDISLEHDTNGFDSIGYNKINEEIADDNSTFISADGTGTGILTSVFSLSFDRQIEVKNVKSMKLVVVTNTLNTTASATDKFPQTFTVGLENGIQETVTQTIFPTNYTALEFTFSNIISEINNYISNNDMLPNLTLTVASAYTYVAKSDFVHYITQAYVELVCEYID